MLDKIKTICLPIITLCLVFISWNVLVISIQLVGVSEVDFAQLERNIQRIEWYTDGIDDIDTNPCNCRFEIAN